MELTGILWFEQLGWFVTLYHVVTLILANAVSNWGTSPSYTYKHYILWYGVPTMLHKVKIIFLNPCNLCMIVAELSPSKSDEGRDLQVTGFSGHSFAKLRLLKNNILCVRVSLPLIAILT